MFARIVETKSGGKIHRYLRIVENYRHNGKIKQRVLWNLGNVEKVRHKLPGLTKSLGNYSDERFIPLKELKSESVKEYGNMLLLKTVWNRLKIENVLGNDKLSERMRPCLMALTFHHLLYPGGQPSLDEWLGRVYLPELAGPLRSGRVRLKKTVLGLLTRLGRDGGSSGLRVISKAAQKRSASFCYIIRFRMNAPGARRSPLKEKGSLLVILVAGGVAWAYGIYEGKSPRSFMQDLLAHDGIGQYLKGRKTTFVTSRQTVGNGTINLFNKGNLPYVAFINRWNKKAVNRAACGTGRAWVAHRIKTGNNKKTRTYVISRKTARSRDKSGVKFALKTNVTDRAFLTKTVRAHREHLKLQEFLGSITAPPGTLSRVGYKRGYVLICLLAYLLKNDLDKGVSRLQMGSGFTSLELLDRLKDIKLVTNTVSGRKLNYMTKIPRQMNVLLRAFGVKKPGTSLQFSSDVRKP